MRVLGGRVGVFRLVFFGEVGSCFFLVGGCC